MSTPVRVVAGSGVSLREGRRDDHGVHNHLGWDEVFDRDFRGPFPRGTAEIGVTRDVPTNGNQPNDGTMRRTMCTMPVLRMGERAAVVSTAF